MMMAGEGLDLFGPGDDDVDDDGGDLSMDLDTFWHILGEDPEQPVQQSIPEELAVEYAGQGEPILDGAKCENLQLQNGNCLMVSECGNPQSFSQIYSPSHTCWKHNSWFPLQPCHEACCSKSAETSEVDIPSCSTSSSFAVQGGNHLSDGSHNPVMGTLDVSFGNYGASSKNSLENLGPENNSSTSLDFSIMNADMSSQNATSTESTIHQSSDVNSEWNDLYSMEQFMDVYNELFADQSHQYIPNSFYSQMVPSHEGFMNKIKDEEDEFPTESASSSSKMMLNAEGGKRGGNVLEVVDYIGTNGQNYSCDSGNYISPVSGNSSSNFDGRFMADKALPQPLTCVQSKMSRENQYVSAKNENSNGTCFPLGVIGEAVRNMKQPLHGILSSKSNQKLALHTFDKEDINLVLKGACHGEDTFYGIASESFVDGHKHLSLNAEMQGLPFTKPSTSNKQLFGCIKGERDVKLIQPKGMSSDVSKLSFESSSCRSILDNDPDICIIEEFSHPARPNQSLMPVRSVLTSQRSTYDSTLHHTEVGSSRFRENDERSIFQAALQDLSQPKSEASPPDGLLAVPLLRHQRIALSWMVNKETTGTHCSGGILADDQGLGKTISTIAILLKERSISSRASPPAAKQGEPETLNLDEDDDETADLHEIKENGELYRPMPNGSTAERRRAFVVKGGRPAAGTLVVCPTSVLRQWADELDNKVTSKADLSVLVYHGSNRTKDPYELAKYDVVLTTYSIVSMEVAKQPLANKDTDHDEKGNLEADVDRPMGLSSNKKRKYPPTSGKKCSMNKKGRDSSLLESISRPLAKVGWFRVVLDEAQSIKNHKTQVARACWGLRAKRRWCLSGTPIQNAVDDLYSYFRFLRYEPYSSYQEFCSKIKVPINKHSSKGYKKLQAVLKTIMLRRTKGTLLDGQPIITLPPKSVELKKVEFSKEERDFYTKLEADSRAQFEEYAAAGTVKQNYVNILLMLLRLRQACDHPLLVKGRDSSSVWKSSVESAMKFPQEKRSCLLSCLEDSLALCGICNDPPEDAVVTACSHVFCNQCILEHLSGEDNQCPVTNCKDPLCVSSVFSRHTLTSSLFCGDSCSNGSELVETTEYCSEDSSKIRAALEVMRSLLPKPASENDISSEGTPQNCLNSQDKGISSSSSGGEKAIVFSQWTKMLDLVEASLKSSSIHYRRLDGTMSVVARDKAVKDFNTLPEVTVIIMSLKAASLGLNMVAACHVVLLDLWWNPTTEDQAIDRAHRIGQTRPVKVVRLTVKDTVEDRILALQQKKREMVASAFGEDESGSRETRLTVEDLKYLFTA